LATAEQKQYPNKTIVGILANVFVLTCSRIGFLDVIAKEQVTTNFLMYYQKQIV